ncbi:MAG: hypothetical protein OHK0026_04250 [Rhodocyclaceae bacterium]
MSSAVAHGLRQAVAGADLDAARALFAEYQQAIGLDLCFQGFDAELAGLPGAYAPPRGRLYVAWMDGEPAGCGALRPFDAGTCEMKRLYVRGPARGRRLGREIARRLIEDARAIGYRRMVLDTLARMREARALYASLGFVAIPPYGAEAPEERVCLALDLAAEGARPGADQGRVSGRR